MYSRMQNFSNVNNTKVQHAAKTHTQHTPNEVAKSDIAVLIAWHPH